MKKLYAVVSLCSFFWGHSQINLNNPETKSRTVTDPVSITLSQGFRAASSEVEFTARIQDSNPSNPPSSGGGEASPVNPSTPSGTLGSNLFHDTQGNIEVNGVGQLQFTLPIALPPGVKSVAPQVNLVYTSGSGNGIAGYGWNLSGITSIARVGKNIDKDGKTEGISLTYNDYYSFNGQRLILKSGEYGKDGSEYVTEKFSNVKIKAVGQRHYFFGTKEMPDYWEVTFEDGSQAWYGLNNSKTFFEYNITKWKDAQGNYITYEYEASPEEDYSCNFDFITGKVICDEVSNILSINHVLNIKSIRWGGNEALGKSHFNEMTFQYTERDFKESSYISGEKLIQRKILTEIQINTNDSQFKKYVVNYDNSTKYQFVKNITEYNSKNEPANPVVFEYNTDGVKNDIIRGNSRFDDIYGKDIITGDFDGDGKLDILNTKQKVLLLNRLNEKKFYKLDYRGTFASKTNTTNNFKEYIHKDAIVTYEWIDEKEDILLLRYYFFNGYSSELIKSTQLDLREFNISDISKYFNGNTPSYTDDISVSYKDLNFTEGDFDGDGKSEFIISTLKTVSVTEWMDDQYGYPERAGTTVLGNEIFTFYYNPENSHIYRMLDPLPSYSRSIHGHTSVSIHYFTPLNIGDFDGDGKTDIFEITDNNVNVYSFDSSLQSFNKIHSFSHGISNKGRITGDFNGDGKTDFMVPIAEGSSDWKMYLSTGSGFVIHNYPGLFLYEPYWQGAPRKRRNIQRIYNAPDLNKDGKSDFIVFQTEVWYKDGIFDYKDMSSSYGFTYLRNDGIDKKGKPIFSLSYHLKPIEDDCNTCEYDNFSGYGEHFIPIFGNFKIAQLNTDFIITHKTKLITWNMGEDINKISRIKSITQGGLRTEVDYKELDPVSTKDPHFYAPVKQEKYPYMELEKVSQSYAVSQLRQIITPSQTRKQDFRYRGFVTHLQGKGMIGFRKTARSSWYADGFENTKVWSGAEIDPLNEGLPIKEWSIKTNDETQIFPKDVSLNNQSLLSFKSTQYKVDKLVNGVKVSALSQEDKPKAVTAIVPTEVTTKDFIKETTSIDRVEYNELYLPVKTISSTNNGFAEKTTQIEYYPANLSAEGKDYSVGRPRVKTELVRAYGDSKGAKEEYHYENNLLKSLTTYNRDNSGWLKESYEYDGFGNITTKTISNSVDSNTQTSKTEYEDKGRFVIKKTDNLGLITLITYNDWGQVLTQKDPLGNTLTNTYDSWGKLLSVSTNLGGTKTITYEKLNNHDVKTTEYSPDGGVSISFTNKIGQTYKSTAKVFLSKLTVSDDKPDVYFPDTPGFGNYPITTMGKPNSETKYDITPNTYASKEVHYDALGRKIKESEAYLDNASASQWNTIEYDEYSRPIKATAFTGKIVETKYTKNTVTATETNANNRFKKQTFDALGNITSTEDKGGIIEFKYNAAGEVIEAKYGTNIVTTKYDAWGRKIEYHDPSNGLYKYEYHHGFGLLTKEISPKGFKEYTYNDKGQLISLKEKSNKQGVTDKEIHFAYNDKGMLLSKTESSKGKAFSSHIAYDKYGRVIAASEESFGKKYERKNVVYDPIGRVHSYEKSLTSSGKTTHVVIENVYDSWSGTMYQLKDKSSGKVLWELEKLTAKGKVLKAKLGGTSIQNTYDANDFLSAVSHKAEGKPDILSIAYSFNAIKNELNSRNTSGAFNILERFVYDDNNRLINWTNPRTGELHHNVYDKQGRIIENDQLGKIKFENKDKVYQPTGMSLNEKGAELLKNNLIQKIEYNENNDPVFIDGVKGDVRFEYGLTAMRQMMTFGGEFLSENASQNETSRGKFTRFYSEDGSFEVTLDHQSGKEKHILYIGGNPYESEIIFVKDFKEEKGSYKFLHKDYLGSILAISDEEGNKLEQRHYDAWGNLTHLQIGNGEIITDPEQIAKAKLLLDRGYTSHEHLWEVGIIHMNGRLYDPLLRRFLNADENIQDPHNTQNYNKYGYVFNNPLMYNDPSGEFAWMPLIMGIVSYAAQSYYFNTPITFEGLVKSIAISYIGAGISNSIGTLFQVGKNASLGTKILMGIGKMAAHGISQGVLSMVQGGKFWEGALPGAISSAVGDLLRIPVGGNIGKILDHKATRFAIGTIMGGVSSKLAGGNFWQGTAVAGVVTLFNHMMHDGGPPSWFEGDYYKDPETGDEYYRISKDFFRRVYADGTADNVVHVQEVMLYGRDYNFRESMKHIDKFGNIVSGIGLALTMTGVGAEIGIPLMSIGGYISLGARGMAALSYAYQGKFKNFAIESSKIATEVGVGRLSKYLIKPLGSLGINQELGSEFNTLLTSEVVIPMVEQQTKTVN